MAEEQLLQQLPLLTQQQTSTSSCQAAPTLIKLTPLCLGAMAAICAVPAQAQLQRLPDASQVRVMSLPESVRWIEAQGVDTTHSIPVPGFRLRNYNVPTEWYTVPGLNTQFNISASAPLTGPWQAVWTRGLQRFKQQVVPVIEQGQRTARLGNCMQRHLDAVSSGSVVVPCREVAQQ